ncbi:aromatic amino acid transport family protein [Haloferax sp. ATB1]|uniref:aromatic amino acid transport family protein n=1 Tax=Haloferax sp. ATB1 TaxID=1508454 RepID=UPI000693213C|nr:aromatic amino acid transport family protein [Haloferax sp. ATB1]
MTFTEELRGASLIIGSIIGAGVLGIPYAAAQIGLLPSLILMLVVGVLLYATSIILLRFSAKSGGSQIVTLASDLLGRPGGYLMMGGMMVYIYGALLAYTSAGGQTLAAITPLSEVMAAILFWIVASFMIYQGLEASIKMEFALVIGIVFLFLVVALTSLPHGDLSNADTVDMGAWQAFVGVALFAFVGHAMIPDVYRSIGDYEAAKRSIRLAFVLIFALYVILTVAFVLVFGREVPQIGPQAFEQIYGTSGLIIGNVLPLITVMTSFIGFGLAQKNNYVDYNGLSTSVAWALTAVPPLVIYLYGVRSFVGTLKIAGNVGALIITLLVPIAMYVVWNVRGSDPSVAEPSSSTD